MLWANVSPFSAENHGDVTDVPQTQACAIHPEGFAARGAREAGHSDTLIICARQMRYQVFDRLILDCFPCPGNRKHKAPAPSRIVGVALDDHLHILLRTIGRVARDDHPLGPRGRIRCAPFRLVTAVPHEIDGTILRRWQGVQRFLDPSLHQ